MDDLQRAITDRRELWLARDRAGELNRRVADVASGVDGDTPTIDVSGEDPDDLLRATERSLAEVDELQQQMERLARDVEHAEDQIALIEAAAARRRQQLIGLAVLAVLVLIVVIVAIGG